MDVCKLCHEDDNITQTDHVNTDSPIDSQANSQAHIRTAYQMSESQSDTGANRHPTNVKHMTKECQPVTPFSIDTIEGHSSITVMGKGHASIQTTGPDEPLICKTLHSPKASGSAFCPEKCAADNESTIDSWHQCGHVTNKLDAMQFFKNDKTTSTTPSHRRNRLWHMKMSNPE